MTKPVIIAALTVRPEDFGAVGDGQTNDSEAFARMAATINSAGGGTIVLRPTVYLVGGHVPDPNHEFAYAPAPIMNFSGCRRPLTIMGNGAKLKCADGLRFGTFDPLTGIPTQHALPYYGIGELASPYVAMIDVRNCTGFVSIESLELDGNVGNLSIGGPRGDTGWQLPASGLYFLNNRGGERVSHVHTHHHAQDGMMFDGQVGRNTRTLLENVVSEFNGRQGCSVVGGSNYAFVNCKFNHTGRGGLSSAPGAGVDIEAETNAVRNVSFSRCEFSNNVGAGMIADSGDSDGATFTECLFVGTTTWSAWPRKPNFRFSSCRFVGGVCHAFGDDDPQRAARFSNCSFTDDPTLSPTGDVFGSAIVDLGSGDANVLFDECEFQLEKKLALPWTLSSTYNNCTMSQITRNQAYPRGTFTGSNRIDGNVDLYSSKIIGKLIVNGQEIPPTGFFG